MPKPSIPCSVVTSKQGIAEMSSLLPGSLVRKARRQRGKVIMAFLSEPLVLKVFVTFPVCFALPLSQDLKDSDMSLRAGIEVGRNEECRNMKCILAYPLIFNIGGS